MRASGSFPERFDLGGAVDVGDDVDAGVALLVGGEFAGVARFGEGAAGVEIGQEDFFVGVDDLGGFGHEVDAAEEDDVGLGGLGLVGEAEGVADVIGHFLDFAVLIIMGEDDGVFLFLEGEDFLLKRAHRLNLAHSAGGVYARGESIRPAGGRENPALPARAVRIVCALSPALLRRGDMGQVA